MSRDTGAEAAFTHELFEWAVKDNGALPTRLHFRLQIAHDLRVVLEGLGDWIHTSPEDLLM